MSSSSRVELHLYDVSKGFAKHLAPAFLGMEAEGLWHSGIVVNGVEYHYGPSGLWRSFPQQTFLGTPSRATVLGQTSLAGDDLEDAIRGLVRSRYSEEQYDVLFNNGNHFVNDLSLILTGSPLPDYVLNQIQDILATPMGERLVYLLPPFLFSRNQRPSPATPEADPAAPSTSRGPAGAANPTSDTVMDDPTDACPKYGTCPKAGDRQANTEDPQAEYRQYQEEYQDLDVSQLVQDVLQNLLMGWRGAAAGCGPSVDPQEGCGPHGFRPHHGPYHHPHEHPHDHPHHHPNGPPSRPPHGPSHPAPHGPPHGPPPHHLYGAPPHPTPPGFGVDHGPHGLDPHRPDFGLGGFPGNFGPGSFGMFGFGPHGFGFGPFGLAGPLRGLGPMGGCMKRRGPCGMGFGYGGGRGRGCGGRRGRGCGPWGGRGCGAMEGDFYGYDREREEAPAAPAAAVAGDAAGPSTSVPKPQAPSAPAPSAPQSEEPHPSALQQSAAAPTVHQAPMEAPVPAAEAEAAASVAAELARISVAGAGEGQAVTRRAGDQGDGEAEAAASQWDMLNVEEVAGARKIE